MSDKESQNLEEAAQGIRMNTEFKAHLEMQLKNTHTAQMRKRSVGKKWLYLAACLCVGVIALSPLPVIAHQFIEIFFVRLSADRMVTDNIATETPEGTQATSVWFTVSSMAEAESALEMKLKEPTMPTRYTLESVSYRPAPLQVTLVYSRPGRSLIFSQGHKGWMSQTSVGVSATITSIQIRGVEGEYVEGLWTEDGEHLQWRNGTSFRRLRWQENEMQYEIFAVGGSDDTGDLDIVRLAESIR